MSAHYGISSDPHYGTAVVPARPYKPRDKAKVEVGVQVVQRWILARLRHQQFFSLAELNSAIAGLVEQLNDRTMRGLCTTRRALFEQFDRPELLPLPPVAYEYADWQRCRVGLDYHVAIDRHFYSVPHDLLRQEVEARITAGTVELFHRGKRVADQHGGSGKMRRSLQGSDAVCPHPDSGYGGCDRQHGEDDGVQFRPSEPL